MLNFETLLIILACAVPVVALLFVLPKFKKKEKKPSAPVKTLEEVKKEEAKVEVKPEPLKGNRVESSFAKTQFDSDDFKNYINYKQNSVSKPSRVDLPKDYIDRTEPYMPRRRKRAEEKPKTVAEEICSLSPELKALIFTGALDKKYFD